MKKFTIFLLVLNFVGILKATNCNEKTTKIFCGPSASTSDCYISRNNDFGTISCYGGFYISGGEEKFDCNDTDNSDINIVEIRNLPNIYFPDAGGSLKSIDLYFCKYNLMSDYAREFDNVATLTQDGTKSVLTHNGNVNARKWKIETSDSLHFTPQWYDNKPTNSKPIRNCTGFICGEGGTCSTKGDWPYGGETPYDYDKTAHCDCDSGYHNINNNIYK